MNSKIDRIIKEEIDNFILNEVADFQRLSQLNKTLYTLTNEMSKTMSVANLDVNRQKFMNNFKIYCLQIINAIKRCVQRQSINEVSFLGGTINLGGLSDYGINIPGHLGGNIYSDYQQGYHGLQNWLSSLSNGDNSNTQSKNNNGNGNTVKSVKLLVLLQNLPRWQQAYSQMNANREIDNQIPQVGQILANNGVLVQISQATQ